MTDKHPPKDEQSAQHDRALIDAARGQVEDALEREKQRDRTPSTDPAREGEPRFDGPPTDSFTGYKIIDEIHRGGQGVVYKAVQESTKRKVAIKVMKEGPFAGSSEKARFEREVQILGQLKHPNIVTVYDSGTAAGSFYFVMDYISGQPLDAYLAAEERSIEETLKLFGKICDAVNAAHLHGVIHRDLKPGNIRVDPSGEPHILDFGLAKVATGGVSAMTMTGQFIGSLPWASPEQAEGIPSKVDLRTDVYSLGVILYQMLTGKFPYDVVGNMRDVLDRIMKAEPARPSTIRRQINDEVETIVLKCLSKERERRYQTAGELARDVGLYLGGEPIEAKRDSFGYVLRKQLRRYRVPAATAAAFVVLLIAGTVVSTTMYLRAEEQRRLAQLAGDAERKQRIAADAARQDAEKAENEQRRLAAAESAAREEAQRDRKKAEAVSDFLTKDLLAAVAPSSESGKGKDVLMRDVLDEAAKRIEEASRVGGRFEELPLVEASIRATLGWTYYLLGEYAAAEPHLERARLLRRRELGEEHPSTLLSMNDLAVLYDEQARYDEAEPLYVKTLEIRTRALGDEHRATLSSMNNLAILYGTQSRYDEAETLFVKTLEIRKRVLGKEHPHTLSSMRNLANLYRKQGRSDEAEPLYVRTLEIGKRVLGEEHPDTLGSMNNLANLYMYQGRYDEAEPLYVKTLEIRKRIQGEEHPSTLTSTNNLAALYWRQGRYDEAEPLFVKTLEIQKRVLGDEHPSTLLTISGLAVLYELQGRFDKAEPLYVTTLQMQNRVLGEEHPSTLSSMNNLANLYKDQGRDDEAEPLYVKTLEIRKRVLGEEHPHTLGSMNNLANLYMYQGRYDEAQAVFVKTLEIRKRVQGEEHPDTLASMNNLAALYQKQGRYDEAEPLYVMTLDIRKRVLGEEHPDTLASMNNLANLYGDQGRMHDARPLVRALQEARRRRADRPGASASDKNELAWNLLTCEPADLRDPETALRLARDACAMTDNANPGYLDTLALAQHLTGDTPAAIETEKKALSISPPEAPWRGDLEAALARFKAALKEVRAAEDPGGG